MSLLNALKRARDEATVSSLFPITHLNSPTIFESKEGLLGSVIRIEGVPFVTEGASTLNALSHALHAAISIIDERFICYVTCLRKKESSQLDGEFASSFAKRINDKYHARFKHQALYKNSLYLTVVLKGDTSTHTSKSLNWFKRLLDVSSSELQAVRRLENVSTLKNKLDQLLSSLSKFKPTRLGDKDEQLGFGELIEFLSLIPNRGEGVKFKGITQMPVLSKSIPHTFLDEACYPEGHLGQFVAAQQLLFGDYIQFQGATKDDVQFGAMLSVKKYGQTSASIILDPLLSLDCEFIATHSFAPIPRDAALKTIHLKRSKLKNAGDCGVSQITALQQLEDNIASELALLGHHHNTLMLIAPSIKFLEKAINDTVKAYAHSGFVVIKESLGLEPAFWAQIPGNHALIARASLITSHNFVDFCALHNYQTGFKDKNHLGSAVTLLETPSKTPVWFNYHSQSSKTNPAKGHTVIFGGNNAGKTTLVSFMDAQMGRYQGKSFFLDRDQASRIYILASGNSSYTVIHPKFKDTIRMNPLQLPDSPENRTFVKTWMASLIKRPSEDAIPSTIAEQMNECVDYNFDHLEASYRTLSNLAKCLPIDFQRWPELKRWLKGDGAFAEGEFAWLFDNNEDALELSFDKVGFDITYLMDEVSPLISTPVYLYLVHRMRQCLDGRLTSFIIDEAFQVFNSPFWVRLLRDWLPTIRKKNGHFIFMTQSPQTVIDSDISPVILDNVATMLLFPNALASRTTYVDHLKLTDAQYQTLIRITPESRLFLYKQGHEAILCKLDLSGLEDEIRVLSGNEKSVRLLDEILKEIGSNPEQWLPLFLARSAA